MTPKSYTTTGNTTKFRYDIAELKEWLKQGHLTGDVGFTVQSLTILESGATMKRLMGFGTIEYPRTELNYFSHVIYPPFDGEAALNPDNYLIPPKPFLADCKIVFLSFDEEKMQQMNDNIKEMMKQPGFYKGLTGREE